MDQNLNKAIQDKLELAIVKIATTSGPKGTGFFISFEGHVLTAWHCVEEVVRFGFSDLVVIYNGQELPAELVRDKSLPDEDIAILKVSCSVPLCLPLGLVSTNYRSDDIVSIGYPAHELNASLGRYPGSISRLDGNKIEVAGAIQGKGQSGGLIYHYESNQVVGLVIELYQASIMRNAGLAARFDSLFANWPELKQMAVGVTATWKEQLNCLEPDIEPVKSEVDQANLSKWLLSFIWLQEQFSGKTAADEKRNLLILRDRIQLLITEQLEGYALHSKQRPLIMLEKHTEPELVERLPFADWPKLEPTNIYNKSVLDVFQETNNFLLITGEPGAGKTVTLLELARDLMAVAKHDDSQPIPVIFNLSGWNKSKDLSDWLVEQFRLYRIPKKLSSNWLKQRKILLLLDGLDEVKAEHRASCVEAINTFVGKYRPLGLAVCCRLREYKELPLLHLEGAVCLQPLTEVQINSYLEQTGSSSLQHLIDQDENLRELAETPLLLDLMSFTYEDVTVEEITQADSFEVRREQLFDRYIDKMFERKNKQDVKQKTLDKLAWLASKMQQHGKSEFYLEDIRPSYLGDKEHEGLFKVLFGIGMAVFLGFFSFEIFQKTTFFVSIYKLLPTITAIIISIFVFIFSVKHKVSEAINWSWKRAIKWAILFSFLGVPFGFFWIYNVRHIIDAKFMVGIIGEWLHSSWDIDYKSLLMLGAMLATGWLGLFLGGIQKGKIPNNFKLFPNQGIRQAIKNLLWIILPFSIVFGTFHSINYDLYQGLTAGLSMLLLGSIFFGLIPIIQHYYLRFLLFSDQKLQLNSILNQSTQLFLLRRVGGGYKFIHRLILEHIGNKFDHTKKYVKKTILLFVSSSLIIIFVSVLSFNLVFKFVISLDDELLYGRAFSLYGSGDYESSFQILLPLAEQGYAEAQDSLGFMYEDGLGTQKSYAMAKQWYQKAAEQGHARAQNNLGYMHIYGLGTQKNYVMAEHWYKKAAEQGHAIAQSYLGNMYFYGLGMTQDYNMAEHWYKKSMEQGNDNGHMSLCYLYFIQKKFEEANKIDCPQIDESSTK
ncbi:trypsin-like peptidase domain-containing protein [Candidatus Halobeggiatoa sp. HSG11]|nr:trypsin-like peptidase domain-containing protein [Candidatus Halobeggiatoa sp. HSG11]